MFIWTYIVGGRVGKRRDGVRLGLREEVNVVDLLMRVRVPNMDKLFIPCNEGSNYYNITVMVRTE